MKTLNIVLAALLASLLVTEALLLVFDRASDCRTTTQPTQPWRSV